MLSESSILESEPVGMSDRVSVFDWLENKQRPIILAHRGIKT